MVEKRAVTAQPIAPVLARRYSGRAFDATRDVAHEALVSLLEAARWAPSCFGEQPWRYLVWQRSQDPDGWQAAIDCLVPGNQAWARAAPVLLASFADTRFSTRDEPNRWAAHDTGAASMALTVQATELGLMVHQMGGFDADALRRRFAVPERFEPMAVIALGYALPDSGIPEALRERELAPRSRRPLEETCFAGQWGRPFRP